MDEILDTEKLAVQIALGPKKDDGDGGVAWIKSILDAALSALPPAESEDSAPETFDEAIAKAGGPGIDAFVSAPEGKREPCANNAHRYVERWEPKMVCKNCGAIQFERSTKP